MMSNMTWIGYGHVRHGRDVNGRGGHKDKCKDKDTDKNKTKKCFKDPMQIIFQEYILTKKNLVFN